MYELECRSSLKNGLAPPGAIMLQELPRLNRKAPSPKTCRQGYGYQFSHLVGLYSDIKVHLDLSGHEIGARAVYRPHICPIGEWKPSQSGQKTQLARRWVVGRTLTWLSTYRAIPMRYGSKSSN